jgi:GxxExxY protein
MKFIESLAHALQFKKTKAAASSNQSIGKIIVELKAAKCLTDEHRAQLLNYLKITRLQLGLLIDFGAHPRLEWERVVLTHA